jgi:3-dehydroquinate dehydratase-2
MTTDSIDPAGALASVRRETRPWRIAVMLGPNMRHLGRRDPRLFGAIESIDALRELVEGLGRQLGVSTQFFVSDFEGELLAEVYRTAADVDAYIVDPGGLATISQGWPHALIETRKPVVEVCFYNMIASHEISTFGGTVIARVMGLREYSFAAALLGLVLALDDPTFLHPDAPGSDTVRKDGKPHAFRLA